MLLGIEARILSEEDLNNGVGVNFPTAAEINIPVESDVPSSTISKESFLNYVSDSPNFIHYRNVSWTSDKHIFGKFFPSQQFWWVLTHISDFYTYQPYWYLSRPGQYNLSTPVLVVSVNSSGAKRVELPEDGTVSIMFALPEVCAVSTNIIVIHYDIVKYMF